MIPLILARVNLLSAVIEVRIFSMCICQLLVRKVKVQHGANVEEALI